MELFDEFDNRDELPARHSEGQFAYLNRTGRQPFAEAREILEEWFARYPEDDQVPLRARFRSSSDREHAAAFFELTVHELLLRHGYSVRVEVPITPTGEGSRPDFLAVNEATGDRIYVEATCCFGEMGLGPSPNEDALIDGFNELACPDYWLSVQIPRGLKQTPSVQRLKKKVQRWIEQLDHIAVQQSNRTGQYPCLEIPVDGGRVRVEALARGEKMRGRPGARPVGILPTRGGWVDSVRPIRTSLNAKFDAYGVMDAPFVVALNLMQPFVGLPELLQALYGTLEGKLDVELPTGRVPGTQLERTNDGLWGLGNPTKWTRVSAVLGVAGLMPWTIGSAPMALVLHPNARLPLGETLSGIPAITAQTAQVPERSAGALGRIVGVEPS